MDDSTKGVVWDPSIIPEVYFKTIMNGPVNDTTIRVSSPVQASPSPREVVFKCSSLGIIFT